MNAHEASVKAVHMDPEELEAIRARVKAKDSYLWSREWDVIIPALLSALDEARGEQDSVVALLDRALHELRTLRAAALSAGGDE